MRKALFTALTVLLAITGCRGAQSSVPGDATTLDASAPTASASATPLPPPSLACTSPASTPNADRLTGLPHGDTWGIVATSTNTCATAETNLRAAAKAILGAPNEGPEAPHAAWDHKTVPGDFDRVADRLALTTAEKDAITKNGFAALERLPRGTYTDAFHDIFRNELPIYVSIDAVMHAIFESNDNLIADIEQTKLVTLFTQVLAGMHGALKAASADYPADVAADVDLYLSVARSLLADSAVAPVLKPQPESATLVKSAKDATGMPTVHLFGRDRVIDFSQYTPRGHYDKRPALRGFFRAAMWASRLELNLVSRSSRSSQPGITPDPTETPREELDALALADLAVRAKVDAKLAELDTAWGLLAGPREDVSLADLTKLRASAGITDLRSTDAADKLRTQIGPQFKRTLRFHYMPQGSTELPAITTLLGPRIVPDAQAAMHVVDGEVVDRHHVTADDFAFALGHERAKTHLASELTTFPTLAKGLDAARADVMKPLACTDLYSAWFGAVRALSAKPKGIAPSMMATDAFADLRVDSAIAAFGQMRHNYVLVAAQTYDEAGCQIPDGWVDPAVDSYDALLTYAARGVEVAKALGAASDVKYFERLGAILAVLRRIAADELAGRALSEDEKRFLSMVVEMIPGSTGGPPTYTGWYLELFRTLDEALDGASFVADVFTSSHTSAVDYVGARAPLLGVFVVDSSGAPRTFVGPVARAYGHEGAPGEKRLTDASAGKLTTFDSPWSASYSVPAPPSVALTARIDFNGNYSIRTKEPHAGVIVDALDHHGKVVGTVTLDTSATAKVGTIKGKGIVGLRVRVDEFTAFASPPGVMEESVSIDTMR